MLGERQDATNSTLSKTRGKKRDEEVGTGRWEQVNTCAHRQVCVCTDTCTRVHTQSQTKYVEKRRLRKKQKRFKIKIKENDIREREECEKTTKSASLNTVLRAEMLRKMIREAQRVYTFIKMECSQLGSLLQNIKTRWKFVSGCERKDINLPFCQGV